MRTEVQSSHVAQFLLSLLSIKGIRNQAAIDLCRSAQTSSYEELRDIFLATALQFSPQAPPQNMWERSERQLEECRIEGVKALSYFDSAYPERLKPINDPPAVLFVKGQLEGLYRKESIAIVGTRHPTSFGHNTAVKAGMLAAESGVAVVSGLALGCDTGAHRGCVDGKGVGVAVLAHGLDRVYPAGNRELASQLLFQGGCLVSERPVGVKPTRWGFAYRDRIQSGLADRVLVIETDVKGGTMHTVGYSQKHNRPLACISHPDSYMLEPQTRGNQMLIGNGSAAGLASARALSEFIVGQRLYMESIATGSLPPKPQPERTTSPSEEDLAPPVGIEASQSRLKGL